MLEAYAASQVDLVLRNLRSLDSGHAEIETPLARSRNLGSVDSGHAEIETALARSVSCMISWEMPSS